MNADTPNHTTEVGLSSRYCTAHPWVIQAITGFLSAYFMEHPGFRVLRHANEASSGMHVWTCEIPASMKVIRLLKRLQADIPPSKVLPPDESASPPLRYIIDRLEA